MSGLWFVIAGFLIFLGFWIPKVIQAAAASPARPEEAEYYRRMAGRSRRQLERVAKASEVMV